VAATVTLILLWRGMRRYDVLIFESGVDRAALLLPAPFEPQAALASPVWGSLMCATRSTLNFQILR
jgi:hypothetical protein